MRRLIVAPVAVAFALGIWGFGASAQVTHSTPCEDACYEQKSRCVSACGEHSNPMECDDECNDQLADCLRHCGR